MVSFTNKKILLYNIQGGKCYNCGESFSFTELTIDHILPKKRASKTRGLNPYWVDFIINLRLLCINCHLNKRPPGFFFTDIEKIEKILNGEEDKIDWIKDAKLKNHFLQTFKFLSCFDAKKSKDGKY